MPNERSPAVPIDPPPTPLRLTEKVLLKREEAAELASVSPDRIDRRAVLPGFPVIRDGQLVRIHRQAFEDWLCAWAKATNERPPEIRINAPRTMKPPRPG